MGFTEVPTHTWEAPAPREFPLVEPEPEREKLPAAVPPEREPEEEPVGV